MNKGVFRPEEVLFSLTDRCNLSCSHCDITPGSKTISFGYAIKFVRACASAGLKRMGFTGGEPFLAGDLLSRIIREAVRNNIHFNRIMTNGVWFKNKTELVPALKKIHRAGYDGDICVSVDAFHRQDLRKAALFIEEARRIWDRPDVISIAAVMGAKEAVTRRKLTRLARMLNAKIVLSSASNSFMKKDGLFIKILFIKLSSAGKAARVKHPWGDKWFKDDFCKGPGNALFVLPDGRVLPCCGYSNDADTLTIGSIKKDGPKKLIRNALKNSFVSAIFSSGLHPIRKKLELLGVRFPGRTLDHCFFCGYLTKNIDKHTLNKALGY